MTSDKQETVLKEGPSFVSQRVWLEKMNALDSIKETVDIFLNEISGHLSSGVVYFKYVPAYHTFVASRKINLNIDIQGLGIDLLEQRQSFEEDILKHPENIIEFDHFVRQVFSVQKYSTLCLESDGEVKGVFLFLKKEHIRENSYIISCLEFLSLKVSQIDMKRKIHNLTIYDAGTHVFNRRNFLKKLTEEVYRGRRINWPVSLLIISIDRFGQYVEDMPKEDVDRLLKMLAVIMRKNSRLNDISGRMASEEFGMILPHTLAQGAVMHAERLRNIVESANFSKFFPRIHQLTVSFGVSEYPSLCKGMDGLLESADGALSRIGTEGNKVLLAKTPDGLIPDFISNRFGGIN